MLRLNKILRSVKTDFDNVIDFISDLKAMKSELEKCKHEISALKEKNELLENTLKEKSEKITKDMEIIVTVLKNLFFNVDEITRAFQMSTDNFYAYDNDSEDEEGH